MNLKILWPEKTKNKDIRALQDFYLGRIRRLAPCAVIETKGARGISERDEKKIKDVEAQGLEKHIKDDYIICLFDKGREMSSEEFARFLEKISQRADRSFTFIVGGFLGLADRILQRADMVLSLSRMTFSHELSRIVLLEQIYRSLTIIKGKKYAK